MNLRTARAADALAPVAAVAGGRVSAAAAAAAAAAAGAPVTALGSEVAVMLLADIAPAARWWGWWRIVRGAQSLRGVPGLRWAKVLGSGHEGGFGLRPSASRQGLFVVFADEAAADAFIDGAVPRAYRERTAECCIAKLRAWSVRGHWSGSTLTESAAAPPPGAPMAALTRASIRPRRAWSFWQLAAPAQAALGAAPGCLLAVGLGEAPLLRQATFSLWDSVQAMDDYARSGAHLAAIRAAQREGYFSESMFVRFVLLDIRGQWHGTRYG